MKKPAETFRGPSRDSTTVGQESETALKSIRECPILYGVQARLHEHPGTPPANVVLTHKLGRMPQGYIPIRIRDWAQYEEISMNAKTITFTISASIDIDFWIY